MGDDTTCDFCGDERTSTDLVPVQRRSDARACQDCAILMETRSDSFVVEADRPATTGVRETIGDRLRGAARPPGQGPDAPDRRETP